MTIPEKAAQWAVSVANDDSHGYDQGSRWGPDYDCSSLVISAYKVAGLPLQSTYTGNMRSDFFNNGFAVASGVNLATGSGLLPGDVLLNEKSHTALYIGNGQIVHARGNENGGVTGGQPGDQTGLEICVQAYFNFPWDYVLRYVRKEDSSTPPADSAQDDGDYYTVKTGDSLWEIAERLLGNGTRYGEIMKANGLTSIIIHPGQRLIIPGGGKTKTLTVTVETETYELLQLMADGWGKTIGQVIDSLMEDAR